MGDDYGAFDIRQLWQMIDAAKNDLGPTHRQISAWLRTQQMLDQHSNALRGFRNQLAAKWPPESNAASAAYLSELDRLLDAVSATAEASASNAVHVGHVSEAIEQTHAKLMPLHEEYVRNEKDLADYNAHLDAVGAVVGAQGGSLIGGMARGATKAFTVSPVEDGRQEELLRQAREAMTSASSAARDASTNLKPPPEYIPPYVDDGNDDGRELTESGSGGAHRPPAIDRTAGSSAPSDIHQLGHQVPHPDTHHDTARQLPELKRPSIGNDVPGRPSPGHGPVLEDNPGPATPPRGPILGGTPPEGPPTGAGVPQSPAGASPTWIGGRALQQRPSDNGRVQARPVEVAGSGISAIRIDSIPQSVGMPNANSSAGQPKAGIVQKVNPVGGLIGQPDNGYVGQSPLNGKSDGGKRRDRARWDPDNPWSIEKGVATVIEPDPIQEVDPGPGIIGRDR